MSDYRTSIDGPVATFTLDRPAALNALSTDMVVGMRQFFGEIERDPRVRCLVINGGGEHFMAGGDLKFFLGQFQSTPDREARRRMFEEYIHALHPAIFTLRRMRKPVIASVQGACAGFGLSLAMACDLTIAADNAYFTLAYINIATSPDGSGTYFLPRLVGLKTAMEIALLGDRFDAATAKQRGLVNFVVPAADLAAETAKLAGRLAAGPTHAIGNTKALLNASLGRDLETQLAAEAASFADCAAADDMEEGLNAFVAKRRPVYKGT
jgi:2-(1,2-epoxy-1,2-dihydrophenyl)acetyl-CoA isomerase